MGHARLSRLTREKNPRAPLSLCNLTPPTKREIPRKVLPRRLGFTENIPHGKEELC